MQLAPAGLVAAFDDVAVDAHVVGLVDQPPRQRDRTVRDTRCCDALRCEQAGAVGDFDAEIEQAGDVFVGLLHPPGDLDARHCHRVARVAAAGFRCRRGIRVTVHRPHDRRMREPPMCLTMDDLDRYRSGVPDHRDRRGRELRMRNRRERPASPHGLRRDISCRRPGDEVAHLTQIGSAAVVRAVEDIQGVSGHEAGVTLPDPDSPNDRREDPAPMTNRRVVFSGIPHVTIDGAHPLVGVIPEIPSPLEIALAGGSRSLGRVALPRRVRLVGKGVFGRHHQRRGLRVLRVRAVLGDDVHTGHAAIPVDSLQDAVTELLARRPCHALLHVAGVAGFRFGPIELRSILRQHRSAIPRVDSRTGAPRFRSGTTRDSKSRERQ